MIVWFGRIQKLTFSHANYHSSWAFLLQRKITLWSVFWYNDFTSVTKYNNNNNNNSVSLSEVKTLVFETKVTNSNVSYICFRHELGFITHGISEKDYMTGIIRIFWWKRSYTLVKILPTFSLLFSLSWFGFFLAEKILRI